MRLAKYALLIALVTLAMVFAVSAQTLRSPDDNRNTAPTVGTGGTTGGPTGLFTIYDGQTLRRGEYTFSAAYSNYDRDPGNVDITEIPVSFQIGLSDKLELFFNTDAYRGIKVNNPSVLSSFYLPNSQLTVGTVPGAMVLAPGTSGFFANQAVYRPAGAPFVVFPYSGNAGTYNMATSSALTFGTGTSGNATLGPVRAGGAADMFPGVGSVYGSILPGVVLATTSVTNLASGKETVPTVFANAPIYLPDAPFINRKYGQSAFSTFNVGGKWRFTGVDNPVGVGVMAFYRWYADTGSTPAGFNQLQRGASPGGNRGDIGATLFADVRARSWANISGNVGYIYNSNPKGEFTNGTFTLLDRPDEFNYGVGVDFPVNQYFQPILEFKQTRYVGGRTINLLENNPMDAIAGFRVYPARWFGFGAAYRYHANSQDKIDDNAVYASTSSVLSTVNGMLLSSTTTSGSLANYITPSTDPHGFIFQFWAGRRNARGGRVIENLHANVEALNLDSSKVVLPCPPGMRSASCTDDRAIKVNSVAKDPENDVLTYNYTVSGGRIVGQGANVNWDLSGVKAGTYTITSAVDDGCGFCGKTQTKTITVENCADCKPVCDCPSISASSNGSVTAGTDLVFTASTNGKGADNGRYNWTVSNGTITSGQGTSSINVSTNGLGGQSVTATVDLTGLCAECGPTTASATGDVAAPPTPPKKRLLDEVPAVPADDIKARLDGLRVELANDPTAHGYIITTGGTAKTRAKRAADLKKAMEFIGVDTSRVQLVDRGGSGPINSAVWYVPAGDDNP